MILVIETSAGICSVALTNASGEIVDLILAESENTHAEKLPVMVQRILTNNSCKMKELHAVGVSRGPGSYTGLRIGTSLAKGICYAAKLPLIALNGFYGLAWYAKKSGNEGDLYLSNLDARRDEFYLEVWDSNLQLSEPLCPVIGTEIFFERYQGKQLVICGNASDKIRQICGPNGSARFLQLLPQADFLCSEAAAKFESQNFEDLAYFEPRYLKEFVPGLSKKNSA